MKEQVVAQEPEQAPVDEQDQANTGAPEEGSGATDAELFDEKFDASQLPKELQSRYREMSGDYTRKTQELAEQRQQWESEQQQYQQDLALVNSLRNDPEYQLQVLRELAQAHGYEIDEQELEQQEEEQQFLDPRVDELLAERQAEQEQAWADQVEEQIYSSLDDVAAKDGVTLDDKEREVLLRYVTMSPLAQDGRGNPIPDVQGAYEVLKANGEAAIKRYVDSKNAPSLPPLGKAGSPDIDLKDPDQRRARGVAVLQAQNQG